MALYGGAGLGKTRSVSCLSQAKVVETVDLNAWVSQNPCAALVQVLLVAQQTHMFWLGHVHRK